MKQQALDLFCCAGGASDGLTRAGFDVTGIDRDAQPEYPYDFAQADALALSLNFLGAYDFIWASPPCQAFTAYRRRPGHVAEALNLIPQTRALLKAAGVPYVIENVPGAPLENPITLCGSMFGLDVKRHRIFETSFPVTAPPCDHSVWTPRFPGATNPERGCEAFDCDSEEADCSCDCERCGNGPESGQHKSVELGSASRGEKT